MTFEDVQAAEGTVISTNGITRSQIRDRPWRGGADATTTHVAAA
jgi:hypothetical protein